ncbi:thioredoxin-dependent thiol peroxidase [Pontivivens ytuae]|uniref:thioredoxin-dependent peroxiredoxin n=1 Tax=Pontivivens ytuae TaxID=2789856 RepID=A0A7S9LSN4_9RHOB|nr:thioredoxin-dependent thiol peroxidase [Pontivivens ytuae]QPH54250.1 thioredoxin-dependent thiol peroxidase [Pontivivens ytuae]
MTDLTGQAAPDFSLPASGGQTVSLADYAGKPVVLFFYPKADTSGCTKEAVGFTEAKAEFEAAGAALIGISKDPVKKQDKFADKHSLGMPLMSDEEGDVSERYGVWKEKQMYGKTYMGIERSTFLIGPDGKVLQEWRKVKVPGHVEDVLTAVKGL